MDNETKEFLVKLFDEQEKKLDAKFDARFAEQEKKLDAKFDARFAEQDKKMMGMFAEQREMFETEFTKLRNDVTNIVGEILDVMDRKFKRERRKTNSDINKVALL